MNFQWSKLRRVKKYILKREGMLFQSARDLRLDNSPYALDPFSSTKCEENRNPDKIGIISAQEDDDIFRELPTDYYWKCAVY